MPKEIIISLIAMAGVLISAAMSWIVSRRQVNAEVERLRLEIQRSYATNLNNKRLEVYPALYSLMNDYTVSIQNQNMSLEKLKTLSEKVSEWYTRNGLLLSGLTNGSVYTFLRTINRIAQKSEAAFTTRLAASEQRQQLIQDAWKVQVGLKNDIGIYKVEFSDLETNFSSYSEIDERLKEVKRLPD